MKIATILFTYNRPWHTEQVLKALENSTEYPEKLFVFQDGLKEAVHEAEWQKVNKIIHAIDFCPIEVCVSDENNGLAKSIVSGINCVFEDYDAVIVLEDDCVPSKNFIGFMNTMLKKYSDNANVYCVSGYAWPIDIKKDIFDVYGCGRISSWGWGTWKDRWKIYKKDYEVVKEFKHDRELSEIYALWGTDLEKVLISNIQGISDSWAVFWTLEVIRRKGICINPYRSMIKNIGMDGSGVHCDTTKRFDVEMDDTAKVFNLPDNPFIKDEIKKAFAPLYGSYTAASSFDPNKENALVYGVGDFYMRNEKQVNADYNIIGFIDSYKKGYFEGRSIVKPDEIDRYKYDKILIMMQSIQTSIDIARVLIKNVDCTKIIIGVGKYGAYNGCYDDIKLKCDGSIELYGGGITLCVYSEDEFNNVYEVMANKIYHYYVNNSKKDIVIDIGMNVADAALYFAANSKVEKVYAYEPFKETYLRALNNIQCNPALSDKILAFQYGISDRNSEKEIHFNSNMTCGQSTLADLRQIAYEKYIDYGLVYRNEEQIETIEVKDAAEVFAHVISKHIDRNFILKMDCEGEEYQIVNRLSQANILNKFSFIMLEWHYLGNKSILELLKVAGFSYWCENKNNDMGLIYAYRV